MKEAKNELNRNFTKLTHKKGISLIVLIVTIIVIIILAVAVILTVGKNNPVESAREAKFKEDILSFQDDLALSISKDYTAQGGQRDNKFSGITYEEIQEYIPSFTKEYEGKLIVKNDELVYVGETVSEKEINWLNDINIGIQEEFAKKVAERPIEYYGKRITNYTANEVSDWKIFYADEKNVYLITSEYVPVDKLPETSAKHKPANANSSYPKAAPFDNIINDYDGSSNITEEKIKALNKSYFDYLEKNNIVSKNNNMKAVAYMLDTGIWSSFAGEKAKYAIGGPTVEMLMASYSKTHNVDYRAQATSSTGYEISRDGGVNWATIYAGVLSTSDRLYVLPEANTVLESGNKSGANAMWLASPSSLSINHVVGLNYGGYVSYGNYSNTISGIGFRPLVCLKSNVILEVDGDGYKIK